MSVLTQGKPARFVFSSTAVASAAIPSVVFLPNQSTAYTLGINEAFIVASVTAVQASGKALYIYDSAARASTASTGLLLTLGPGGLYLDDSVYSLTTAAGSPPCIAGASTGAATVTGTGFIISTTNPISVTNPNTPMGKNGYF